MHNQAGDRRVRFGGAALFCSALVAACVSLATRCLQWPWTRGATALQQAQRRLRGADEELNRAKDQAAKAEKRVKDAQRPSRRRPARPRRPRPGWSVPARSKRGPRPR